MTHVNYKAQCLVQSPLSINGREAGICYYFCLSINFNTLLCLSDPSFPSFPCGKGGHMTQT